MNSKCSLFLFALIALVFLSMPANAGLANTAWPEYLHDGRNTGMSPYNSNTDGTLNWTVNVGTGNGIRSIPTIDSHNNVVVSEDTGPVAIFAYRSNGVLNASTNVGSGALTSIEIYANMTSGVDNYLISPIHTWNVLNYNTDGSTTPIWETIYALTGPNTNRNGLINGSTIFQPNTGMRYDSVNLNDGTVNFNVVVNDDNYLAVFNNRVYAASNDGFLYAVQELADSHIWQFDSQSRIRMAPSINSSGNILFGTIATGPGADRVYNINPDGTEAWHYTTTNAIQSTVTIDELDNVYFANSDGIIISLDKFGTLRWTYNTGSASYSITPITISANHTLYAGLGGALPTGVLALNGDTGTLQWFHDTGGNDVFGGVSIDQNGTAYAGDVAGNLYAFKSTIPVPPVPCCDPSGFVFDQLGNPIQGVKVVISNATYTDACLLTSCYTSAAGLWNGTITADGTYTITASKQGYRTNITSQSLTIGGTANDIILNGSQATLTGHVYTFISGTGTTAIKGNLQDLRVDACGISSSGGTLNIGTSGDGHFYVLKLIDVDSGNQQSLWKLFKDGSVLLYDNVLVNTNEPTQLKIYETFFENVYVDIRVSNVFQGTGGEVNTATTCASFEHVSKSPTLIDWLLKIVQDAVMALTFTGTSGATVTAFSDVMQSTAGTNTNSVFFNSTAGRDAIGFADFQVSNPATIFNFNMALTAESTTANAGKIEIGYTDNCSTCTQDNGFTDEILINSKQSCQANGNGYCTPQHDFKAVDANGDGTIRVWFKFASGFSNFKLYEFYLNAWGTTQKIPLQGVNVYSVNGTNSTVTDALGAYTLLLSLKNNTVFYTKIGYESKNYTFLFNLTNVSFTQDVILNATNGTLNTTKEYLVVPNFVQGTNTNGNFKTLGHTSLIGGYQISICPQLGGDCKIQSVPANTESTFALDPNLPIGTYEADLTGYLGGVLDIGRDVIVSTNFTVTSSSPRVDWANGADGYFLGDAMVLSIYVPSSTAGVNVTYLTNGSVIYSNTFSATGTVQNVTFQTNNNATLSQFKPGSYQGCIEGGNCATTTLYNTSNSDYTLSAPATVNDGDVFNILWKAPHTATLQIVDQNNNIRFTQEVPVGNSLTGQVPVDTTVFTHNVTTITTTLNRNGVVVATATTNITINPGSSPGTSNNLVGSSSLIMNLPWIGLMLLIVVIFGLVKNDVQGGNFVFAVAITTSIEAVLGLWQQWGIYITVLSWLLVAVFFRLNKTIEV